MLPGFDDEDQFVQTLNTPVPSVITGNPQGSVIRSEILTTGQKNYDSDKQPEYYRFHVDNVLDIGVIGFC